MDDSDDCLKSFVCIASSMPVESHQEVEQMITAAFDETINPASESAEYQLASAVGHEGGAEQCQVMYSKCQASYDEIRAQLEEAWKQEEILAEQVEEKQV